MDPIRNPPRLPFVLSQGAPLPSPLGAAQTRPAQFASFLRTATSPANVSDLVTAARPFQMQAAPLSAPKSHSGELSLHERALGLRAYRQEILASNIANADTPGFKARDFDINAAVRAGYSGSNTPALLYRIPNQASADNNTVDLDTERVQFAENALMYEFAVDRVKGHYKEMEELLKGTPF